LKHFVHIWGKGMGDSHLLVDSADRNDEYARKNNEQNKEQPNVADRVG
jgi:hypothetical protein